MKLELKHLAPYLPYGLNCQLIDQGEKTVANLCGAYTDNSYAFFDTVESEHGYEDIKPILRPISDLKLAKFQFINSELDKHIYPEMVLADLKNGKLKFSDLPYSVFEWFLNNHFDVFGIIDAGQAIDINTLN